MNLSKNINWNSLPGLILACALAGALSGPVSCNRNPSPGVIIRTELGEIELAVYREQAPVTASNFLALVEQGAYTNSLFYRVVRMNNQPHNHIKIEVIQGGLYDDSLINTVPTIAHETTLETGILHTNGVISMARNKPGTASTEFFICIGDQPSLDFGGGRNPDGQGFAAFGKVSRGMEIVKEIQALSDSGQYLTNPLVIQEMVIVP